MLQQTCEALVVHCFEFQIQQSLNDWLAKRFSRHNYDLIALAGGVKDFSTIQKQIEDEYRLNKIKKVILIGHDDCELYSSAEGETAQMKDIRYAEQSIRTQFSDVDVEIYYLHLDGEFEKVD